MKSDENIKSPLEYQTTEYDCGFATIINALKCLFYRSEISPEIIKIVMNFTLDSANDAGESCKGGTSNFSMHYLCEWLNDNAIKKKMNLKCFFLKDNNYSIYNEILNKSIQLGGVAILRVYLDNDEHYCLLTKIDDDYAYIFDPYYVEFDIKKNDNSFEYIKDESLYNVKVLKSRVDEKMDNNYCLVNGKVNEIIIMIRS